MQVFLDDGCGWDVNGADTHTFLCTCRPPRLGVMGLQFTSSVWLPSSPFLQYSNLFLTQISSFTSPLSIKSANSGHLYIFHIFHVQVRDPVLSYSKIVKQANFDEPSQIFIAYSTDDEKEIKLIKKRGKGAADFMERDKRP